MSMYKAETPYPAYASGDLLAANCSRLGIPVPIIAKVFKPSDPIGTSTVHQTVGSRRDLLFTTGPAGTEFTLKHLPVYNVTNTDSIVGALPKFTGGLALNNFTVVVCGVPTNQSSNHNVTWVGAGDDATVAGSDWVLGINSSGTHYKPIFEVDIGSASYTVEDPDTWAVGDRMCIGAWRNGAEMGLFRNGNLKAYRATAGTGAVNNNKTYIGLGHRDSGTFTADTDFELVLIWDVPLTPDQLARITRDPYVLWDDTIDVGTVISIHDFFPTRTVANTLALTSVVTREIGVERTADSVKTRVGLGGRQTIRIGSTVYTVAVDATHVYVLNSADQGVTWTSEQVASHTAVSAALCQGAGGQPVLVLAYGTNVIQSYIRTTGGGWTHKTDGGTSGTPTAEGMQIMYDGTSYHLVYSRRNSSTNRREVRYTYSADLSSWNPSVLLDNGDTSGTLPSDTRGLTACMDSDGDIHLIYTQIVSGTYKLRYMKRTSGTWGAAELIEDLGGTYRAVHLSIATDKNKKPWITGTKTYAGVQNVFTRNRVGGSWSSEELVSASAGDQTYPSMGFEDRQYPVIVFTGALNGGTVQQAIKKNSVWTITAVAADATADKTEQLYDPYRNSSVTLKGSFIVFQSSVMLFVTSLIVYGDAAASSGDATFTQTIKMTGRDRVNQTLAMSQVVADPGHAYARSIPSWTAGFSQAIGRARSGVGSSTETMLLNSLVDVYWVNSGGPDTEARNTFDWLGLSQQVHVEKTRVLTVTHTITVSQVGPGLTRAKSVSNDFEFGQNISRMMVKTLTAGPQTITMSQVVRLQKSLNLGVFSNLSMGQGAVRIYAWVWNGTEFTPAWSTEYESEVVDFVILGPTEAPTVQMTLPKPDWNDEDNLKWRQGAIRRNRSGQPKVFSVNVYEDLKFKFTGLLRKKAAQFRYTIARLVGKNVRIRDGNGQWRDVVISTNQVTSSQSGPEFCNVAIEFELKDKVV